MTANRMSPLPAHAGLPGSPGSLYDRAYKLGFAAGMSRGIAESAVDAALLDAYQCELAKVYAELSEARKSASRLRNVVRSMA